MYVDRYLKDNSAAYVKDSLVSQPNLKIISDTIKNEFQLHQNSVYDSNFITKVAGLVREKLNEYPQKLVLTPAHFKEIKNALQSGTMKLDSKNFDVSILIQDLIQHPLLQNLVTQSGLNVDKDYLVNQQKVLFDLEKQIRANNLEIERLKNMNQETDIVKLQNTVNILKEQQINLKDDLAKVRVEFKEKLSSLNIEFKKLLSDILGYDVNNNSVSFKAWINEAFLAKDVLENKLNELRNNVKVDSQSTMDASAAVLMKHIGDSIKLAILRYDEKQQKMHADLKNDVTNNINSIRGSVSQSSIDLSGFDVQEIVRKALAKYDADKTGLVDYALESGGGQVLTTRCTETYSSRTAQYTWFNIPLWYSSNSPRTAITPGTHPGQCWAFQSFPGYLVLQLSLPIQVTGFTMEHVPKELVANGNIDSAPRNFSVWGLKEEQDQNPSLFGYFEYEYDGPSLQYFQVKSDETNQQYFNIVELRVESNHGNPVFSCLYRFRVHGTPITKDEMEKFRSR
ncbi:SUN domain-containing protein 2-like [Ctenocephalides felis]|uniref:SUN domain-containing protein 2-like n=1 Tax=Ctenocephalides felis TaxID=7515 RepID=UPI000E6E3DFC|nr:SUN domain-containing protein 2-like [Ctenocephalides felis]